MKWRKEYSHPLMISSNSNERFIVDVVSTNGNIEAKNIEQFDDKKTNDHENSKNYDRD